MVDDTDVVLFSDSANFSKTADALQALTQVFQNHSCDDTRFDIGIARRSASLDFSRTNKENNIKHAPSMRPLACWTRIRA